MAHYAHLIAFLFIVFGLLWGRLRATQVFGATVIGLIILGVFEIDHLFTAAVNPSVLTIMVLIALTNVVKKMVNLAALLPLAGRKHRTILLRSTVLTALLSGVVNNTPVVALLIPVIKAKANEIESSSSPFLLPLSFAAVVGGTLTLIGTSTNLVLNGLMIENGIEGFHFWDFLLPGAITAAVVLLFLILFAPSLLHRNETDEDEQEQLRHYTTELKVLPEGEFAGKTVAEAKLRGLDNLYLSEILRDREIISPVTPSTKLLANDTLFFTGSLEKVNELLDLHPKGLKSVEHKFEMDQRRDLHEVIVPNNSDLIGKPIHTTNFRARYDAVIVGVHREGKPLAGKIGALKLAAGDLLLLSVGATFYEKNETDTTLLTVSQHRRKPSHKLGREKWFLPSVVGIVVLAIALKWSLLMTVSFVLVSSVSCGLTDLERIKADFNLQLYGLLVLSIAFGSSLVHGGHATYFLELIQLPESPRMGVALLFLITLIFTNFMTNVSAVAIAFPIGAAMMTHYQLPPLSVFLPLAFAASGSFLTPTSYQTHLMVMGPGKYTNRDFFKVGLPVLLIYSATVMAILI